MSKIWIVAEQLHNNTFRILNVIRSAEEPTEEFRNAIIKLLKSYQGVKIPDTTAGLFAPFDKEGSELLAQTEPEQAKHVFESLKSSGRIGCHDIVNIQRSAWCYIHNIDVLEYSFQNGGGSGAKRRAIVNNLSFQAFRKKNCEIINTSHERHLAEGCTDLSEKILKEKFLRSYSDEDIFQYLEVREKKLRNARLKDNRDAIMLHLREINDCHEEIIRRNLTDTYASKQMEKLKNINPPIQKRDE